MEKSQDIDISDRRAVDALYRISTLSGNEQNPFIALQGILDEVISLFGASSASICLINADSDKLLIEMERGLSKESKGFELPIGVGITGWVALYGEPFLCSNVLEEEKYFQLMPEGVFSIGRAEATDIKLTSMTVLNKRWYWLNY